MKDTDLLKMAKTIKKECEKKPGCVGCVFFDSKSRSCIIGKVPIQWRFTDHAPGETKRVPFDFASKKDRKALKGRWVCNTRIPYYECQVTGFLWSGGQWVAEGKYFTKNASDLFEDYLFTYDEEAGRPVGKDIEEED